MTAEEIQIRDNIHSGYLHDALTPFGVKAIIKKAKKELAVIKKKFPDKKIGVAFTGCSGAVVAPILAYEFDFFPIIIRKEGASTHSSYEIEGHREVDAWIIVDDLVETGTTLETIINRVKDFVSPEDDDEPLFLGVWFYHSHFSWRQEILDKKKIYCLNKAYFANGDTDVSYYNDTNSYNYIKIKTNPLLK